MPKVVTKKSVVKKDAVGREMKWPTTGVKIHRGEDALTMEQAKKLLGWEELREKENDAERMAEHLFLDTEGKRIRCQYNLINRPIYWSQIELLKQEILRKRWRLNGEPIIIGQFGSILNGQHSLISLILAVQEWLKEPDRYPAWDSEPTIEKTLVFGIEETDEVINTMDTAKPRTLTDVIFRSEVFARIKPSHRKIVSRFLDYSIRLMWARTGANLVDPCAGKRTLSESMAFLGYHPKLKDCVKYIYEIDGSDGKVRKIMTCGYASALLYLMGSSATDRDPDDGKGYGSSEQPNESYLNWDNWDRAKQYWKLLASDAAEVGEVGAQIGLALENGGANLQFRMACIIAGWNAWSTEEPVEENVFNFEYSRITGEEGKMLNAPICGGIDLGPQG